MKTLHRHLLVLMLLGLFTHVIGQTSQEVINIKKELYTLRNYSIAFDRLERFPKNSSTYTVKKDSIEELYRDQIYKIKHGPQRSQFLSFLNTAVEKDSTQYRAFLGFNYTYIDETQSIRRSMLPTLLEYFNVVKYSLFDQDKEELLPLDDILFLRHKANPQPKPKLMMRTN